MPSIVRTMYLDAAPADLWDAIRDVGAIHSRFAPGFVTATELDDDVRTVSFANGVTVRERIVGVDDARRRLTYAVMSDALEHHNASFDVREGERGGSRLVWTTDLLPAAATERFEPMIDAGSRAIVAHFGGRIVPEAGSAAPAVTAAFET